MEAIADRLGAEVERYFREQGTRFGLDTRTLGVRYVLNWGGFVNHSFHVSDGVGGVHVKVATWPEAKAGLDRWYRRRDLLTRHRAPRILARFEIDGSGFERSAERGGSILHRAESDPALGLVFAAAAGTSPRCSEDVVGAVLETMRGVWSDGALAASLERAEARSAADGYLGSYHDRFVEDLRAIAAEPPPFLSRADLAFLRREAEGLRKTVVNDPAFAAPADAPIHADLWLNNVLWESPAEFTIVDWDDLQLGDPAMDVAMLVGPTYEDLAPLKHPDLAAGALDADAARRLPTLGRASLLDWVIDPLADWVGADVIGSDQRGAVRREKERTHRQALALYRSRYAG